MKALNSTLQKFFQKYWPDLPESEYSPISDLYSIRFVKKGEILLRPGDFCDWTALIHTGLARYYHVVDGKEHIGQFYFPGTVVSDYVSYVTGEPSRFFIDAIADTQLLVLTKEDSEKLKIEYPSMLNMILNYLNMIYISNFERNSSLLLDSAESRYLNLLENRPELIQQVPLYMIASYLGISPEALSRIRNKISHSGI